MNDALEIAIYERLERTGAVDKDWSTLVLAACDGQDELRRALGQDAPRQRQPTSVEELSTRTGTYLRKISVAGIRGIGPPAQLELTPGPGLTLVVGRNGSGKSSFAEGLEVLLTGDSKRWHGRPKVWKDGWRNLHQPDPAFVEAEFVVEGEGPLRLRATWGADSPFESCLAEAQFPGKPKTDRDQLGWSEALVTFRPFLSYNELGSMLDEGPSKLYDALSTVLGLEDLVLAQKALATERLGRLHAWDAVVDRMAPLTAQMSQLLERNEDQRARRCLDALGSGEWNLQKLEQALVDAAEPAADENVDAYRIAATLVIPDDDRIERSVAAVEQASALARETAGTDSQRAMEIASVLGAALELHEHHGDSDCPVCGNDSALNAEWRQKARTEVEHLRGDAEQARQAAQALSAATRSLRQLFVVPQQLFDDLFALGLEALPDAIARKEQWVEGIQVDEVTELCVNARRRGPALGAALRALRQGAQLELERRESLWRPVGEQLERWLVDAKLAKPGADRIPDIKAAESWLKAVSAGIRDERFAPIAEQSMALWRHLKRSSNVELGGIELSGGSTKRRVELNVKVDGAEGAALSVMSQGELHALALSLFLPRATLPESPFRFVVIDDPVQSMDPARVDGLARALEETARDRQVVVFTHDERLPEAVRRLEIAATTLAVTRRPGSVVVVHRALDPVKAYLEDARALVRTTDMPESAMRRVVPGLCRSALEAAATDAYRRRRLANGERHSDVEAQLLAATTVTTKAALALFDDPERGGDVMTRLNRIGGWAGTAFRRCKEGAHGEDDGDIRQLVQDADKLVSQLLKLS